MKAEDLIEAVLRGNSAETVIASRFGPFMACPGSKIRSKGKGRGLGKGKGAGPVGVPYQESKG